MLLIDFCEWRSVLKASRSVPLNSHAPPPSVVHSHLSFLSPPQVLMKFLFSCASAFRSVIACSTCLSFVSVDIEALWVDVLGVPLPNLCDRLEMGVVVDINGE